MPQAQHISFVSPCFQLMNKVANDSKYNLPDNLAVLLSTLRYLVHYDRNGILTQLHTRFAQRANRDASYFGSVGTCKYTL